MNGWLARLLNIAIRAAIVYFLAEAWIFQDDPRFINKAIPLRNTIIVGLMSLLVPIYWFLIRRRQGRYPWGLDNIYLSLYALDMAGNSFNLYNRYYYFDLIPHFHGTGAFALVIAVFWAKAKDLVRNSQKIYKNALFWESVLIASGIATLGHVILEVQEYYTDVLAHTINVRGQSDTINDLAVGIVGTLLYATIGLRLFLRRNNHSQAAHTGT